MHNVKHGTRTANLKNIFVFGVLCAVLSLSVAQAQENKPLPNAQPRKSEEIALVKATPSEAQIQSIAQNREFCGYFGYNDDGEMVSSDVTTGELDACTPVWPDNLDVFASWHTHAGYDESAWSEVPTVIDIEADEGEGVDGYVGTPGGRVWYTDTTDMVVSQVCGLGCIRSDPKFVKGSEGEIAQSYTYEEMLAREAANE